MALVGNLRDFGLSEFLYLVDRGYKSGQLTLQRQGDQARLWFQNGKLVYASHFSHEERLGDLLVRLSQISRDQREQALRIQHYQEPDKPIGQIMVEQGFITDDGIKKSVRMQVEEVTYSLFSWSDGEFRFEPDVLPPSESITISLSIENIIMEGVRRIDEWARINDRIPSLDVVVKFSDQPNERAKGVNLTPDEWRVFARINGQNSIRQIAQQTGLNDFEVARIIYGFLAAGLVTLTKQVRASTPSGGAPNPTERSSDGRAASYGNADGGTTLATPPPAPRFSGAVARPIERPRRSLIMQIIHRITNL